jgi:NADH dehydrogenase [ubiquinone] 1 alpha subcomplex assembly factor 7
MTVLGDRIRALIAAAGPISVADYMAMALGDPEAGYYATREAIGAAGDFVTAPEISQMFGELVGVWCLAVHEALDRPARFHLVELGPGRGTLMADLLRAARIRPDVLAGATVHLVETSPRLRSIQADRLAGLAAPVWHDRVDGLPPDGPVIVVANEFFDALPIRQLVRTPEGWRERMVGLDADGALAFGLGAGAVDPALLPAYADRAEPGAIFELNRPAEAIVSVLAERIARTGGALLAVDYGHGESGFGDTLQAVRRHAYAGVLDEPGAADLTAHVDFAALARAARVAGATVLGPVEQGRFLLDLGLLERAGRLGAGRDETAREAIVAAVERLAGPEEMGTLFKAMAVTSGFAVPGFPPHAPLPPRPAV